MPTINGRRVHWFTARCSGILLVGILAAACSNEHPTQPGWLPPSQPSFDKHGNWGQRGRLVFDTLLRTVDHASIPASISRAVAASVPKLSAPSIAALQSEAVSAFDARYDVQQWAIRYTTVGVQGNLVMVSAAVYLPVNVGAPLPLLSFSHSTFTTKPGPSVGNNVQALAHASHGTVAVLADYLGMGVDSANAPAYLVADAGATTSLDALRATREFLKEKGLALDGRLFISGYSQGGQVAMALARLIESDPRSGFRVTAAAPIAGPYDLYGTIRTFVTRQIAYPPSTLALTYGVAAYWHAYGLPGQLEQLLTASAAAVGERLLTTGMNTPDALRALPPIASNALQPDVRNGLVNDPNATLSRLFRQNDTYDWLPSAPLRLYYANSDIDVPPTNATMTAGHMQALGSSEVTADSVHAVSGELLDHLTQQWFAFTKAREWFDTFTYTVPVSVSDNGGAAGSATTSVLVTSNGYRR